MLRPQQAQRTDRRETVGATFLHMLGDRKMYKSLLCSIPKSAATLKTSKQQLTYRHIMNHLPWTLAVLIGLLAGVQSANALACTTDANCASLTCTGRLCEAAFCAAGTCRPPRCVSGAAACPVRHYCLARVYLTASGSKTTLFGKESRGSIRGGETISEGCTLCGAESDFMRQ